MFQKWKILSKKRKHGHANVYKDNIFVMHNDNSRLMLHK